MVKALVTRPAEDSADLAAALTARGIEPVIEPVMRILPTLAEAPDLAGVQAILLTSANGARAFAQASAGRDIEIVAVGEATANAARAAGFTKVASADGDVAGLARYVTEHLKPDGGRLIHVAGSITAGDLAGDLAKAGFTVERVALYRADPVENLSATSAAAIGAGEIGFVLLMSPRTATLFSKLVDAAGVASGLAGTVALCLSPAVAEALTVTVAEKRVAAKPDQASLLALLDEKNPQREKTAMAETPPPRSTALRGIVAVLAVLVLALIGWNINQWRQGGAEDTLTPRVAALEAKLARPATPPSTEALERRVAALEQAMSKLAATPAPSGAPAGESTEKLMEKLGAALDEKLDQRVTPIEKQFASRDEHVQALEQAVRGSADARTLADLAQRATETVQTVEALKARVAKAEEGATVGVAHAGRRAALALAVGALASAQASGRPFEAQWRTLAGLARLPEGAEASADPKLAAVAATVAGLKPLAVAGVPTLATLRRGFPEVALKAQRADQAGDEAGWLGEIKRLGASLVSVRRTDETLANGIDGVIARAERAMEDGDLAAADGALKSLTGAAATAVAPFVGQVESRIAVERALENLSGQAIEDLAERAS